MTGQPRAGVREGGPRDLTPRQRSGVRDDDAGERTAPLAGGDATAHDGPADSPGAQPRGRRDEVGADQGVVRVRQRRVGEADGPGDVTLAGEPDGGPSCGGRDLGPWTSGGWSRAASGRHAGQHGDAGAIAAQTLWTTPTGDVDRVPLTGARWANGRRA
ncbi:hypothetical protein CBZ_33660 [Cellulomonas biazotea]|uniref:Uncharacterized protein n=1 Tax=Cellulomonas biazotea TaxID=1709 RepID=A0A402DVX9_9CELL|nr:hypothetical protein CBZ_33660 [Cellulomonas biazotea]